MNRHSFTVGGRTVYLYPGEAAGSPLVVLNEYGGDGFAVYENLRGLGARDCSLLVVSGLDWNRDMSPWPCGPVFPGEGGFAGGAEGYLEELRGDILPRGEALLDVSPAFRAVAGYSLGGLFALWAVCETDVFVRAASVSGSVWYPGFTDWFARRLADRRPYKLYFSLGDRESKSKNPTLARVEENTRLLVGTCAARGVEAVYETNPGNHFREPELRTAKGIRSVLE